jgi:hypothetical protein
LLMLDAKDGLESQDLNIFSWWICFSLGLVLNDIFLRA